MGSQSIPQSLGQVHSRMPALLAAGINKLPAGFLSVVSRKSSWSIAVSLLRHHILTLAFASRVPPPQHRPDLPRRRGINFARSDSADLCPGVVSGPANDGSPAFSPDGNTIFFTRSTANWSAIVESAGSMDDGHTPRWRRSQVNGPTRLRRCLPTEAILYSNPSTSSLHLTLSRSKEENPFPASCPTFGGLIAWASAGASPPGYRTR